MFHSDVEGACGGAAGGHVWSRDGVRWTFSPYNAYGNVVQLRGTGSGAGGGGNVTLRQRERPHVLVDANGHPTHLTNGAGWEGDCDRTFTFVQPVDAGFE